MENAANRFFKSIAASASKGLVKRFRAPLQWLWRNDATNERTNKLVFTVFNDSIKEATPNYNEVFVVYYNK